MSTENISINIDKYSDKEESDNIVSTNHCLSNEISKSILSDLELYDLELRNSKLHNSESPRTLPQAELSVYNLQNHDNGMSGFGSIRIDMAPNETPNSKNNEDKKKEWIHEFTKNGNYPYSMNNNCMSGFDKFDETPISETLTDETPISENNFDENKWHSDALFLDLEMINSFTNNTITGKFGLLCNSAHIYSISSDCYDIKIYHDNNNNNTIEFTKTGVYFVNIKIMIHSGLDPIKALFYIVNLEDDVLSGKSYISIQPNECTQIAITCNLNVECEDNISIPIFIGYQTDLPMSTFKIDNDPINNNSSAIITNICKLK